MIVLLKFIALKDLKVSIPYFPGKFPHSNRPIFHAAIF